MTTSDEFLPGLASTLLALHRPMDEEVESWADDEHPDEHDRRFPECEAVTSGNDSACHGHVYTIKVCDECGYTHDGDYPAYRPWPCPTLLAAFGAEHFGRTDREGEPCPRCGHRLSAYDWCPSCLAHVSGRSEGGDQ